MVPGGGHMISTKPILRFKHEPDIEDAMSDSVYDMADGELYWILEDSDGCVGILDTLVRTYESNRC